MIRAFIESILGTWGVSVLNFYETNSLYINSVVVIYGMFIVLSWTNLVNIRKALVYEMVMQMKEHPKINRKSKVKQVLQEISIPWEATIAKVRFPFVAQQASLWPKRLNLENVRSLLNDEELAEQAIKAMQQYDTTLSEQEEEEE